MSASFYTLLKTRFLHKPAKIALEDEHGKGYSYATVDAAAGRIANYLQQLGLHKGDRVAVQVDKSPQALFLYLACLRAGVIYLPLNTGYTDNELQFFLSDATPRLVVCRPQAQAQMQMLITQIKIDPMPQLQTLAADGSGSLSDGAAAMTTVSDLIVDCGHNDLAAILYTSGTTGRPKGAMISHGNLASNGLALQDAWGWRADDVLLHALPLFHVHGLFVASHCALLGASTMLFLPRFDITAVRARLPRSTVMMGVPTFYVRLLADSSFGAADCQNMRLLISGSAPLLEDTFSQFKIRTGYTLLERYGMTETGMNTSNPLTGERRLGTVGPALSGTTIRVVDNAGQRVAADVAGHVEVKGSNVFNGYWQLPEKTAEEFTDDGFFKTGDLGKLSADHYLTLVGRSKDLIISGGYNVYPKEVEAVLDLLEGVKESAVFGIPHADFGEAVTAAVVLQTEHKLQAEALIQASKAQLANYKVPKQIHFVDALPRNTMGKVQKNRLRQRYRT